MNILDDQASILSLQNVTKEEDIGFFLGDKDKVYYLGVWNSFQQHYLKISLNPAALLLGPLWLVYRGMHSLALGFTYTFAFVFFLQCCFGFDLSILFMGTIAFFVYLGLVGNWHYYNHVQKEVSDIKKKEMNRDFEIIEIMKKGGTNNSNPFVLIAFWIFLLGLIMSFSLLIH